MLMLMVGGPTVAQSAASLPFYVSDRFQQVAQKVAQQISIEVITKACPKGKPLCHTMLEDLGKAADAAFAKDKGELRSRLNEFLVSSSSAALMETILGDLVDGDGSWPELAGVLSPVATCLSGLVSRREVKKVCTFKKEDIAALDTAIVKILCDGRQPCSAAAQLKTALEASDLDPGGITRALATVASAPLIMRPDIEIYLKSLADFLDHHPEAGVFEAAYAFVASVRPEHLETTLLNKDFGQYALFTEEIDSFSAALTNCGNQQSALSDWKDRRALVMRYRDDLILSRSPDQRPIERLLAVDERLCSTNEDRKEVKKLKSFARTLKAQLDVTWALQRFATVGLLAASAIDFARSGNPVALDSQIRRTVLFALAQIVSYMRMIQLHQAERAGGAEITAVTAVRAHDILRSCEFQNLSILEQLPVVVDNPGAPRCMGVAVGDLKLLSGVAVTDLGEVPRQDVLNSLDAFASLVQRQRDDYDHVLGALLTDQRAKLVAAVRDPLVAIQIAPTDTVARASLQRAAITLSADPTLTAARVAGAPSVDERQFGPLLALTDGERGKLLAIPPKYRTRGQQRLVDALQKPALTQAKTLLGLPIPHRVSRKSTATTREERVTQFFQEAKEVLDQMVPDYQAAVTASGLNIDLIVKGVTAAAGEQHPVTRKLLLNAAADFLILQVDVFTARLVSAEACAVVTEKGEWTFITDGIADACTVKVLINGVYKPIAEFVWADDFNFTGDSAASLADKAYRSLIASPVVARTMILLNVGLGVNFVFGAQGLSSDPDPARSGFVALTLIDKIGIAFVKYRSPLTQFEAGLFVGGFLDALVRTAARTSDKYWVGGGTIGWSRMWGLDFGLQFHAGGAFPFAFHSDPRPTFGFSLGVPFSYVFE